MLYQCSGISVESVDSCPPQVRVQTTNPLPSTVTCGGTMTISTTPGTLSSASSTTTARIRKGLDLRQKERKSIIFCCYRTDSASSQVPGTGMIPTCSSLVITASLWTRSVRGWNRNTFIVQLARLTRFKWPINLRIFLDIELELLY